MIGKTKSYKTKLFEANQTKSYNGVIEVYIGLAEGLFLTCFLFILMGSSLQ
jgi:hypothetical protein